MRGGGISPDISLTPPADDAIFTGTDCAWYPLSVNVAVNSFAATESAQGVRQVWPVVVLTSAPGGSDSNSKVAAGVLDPRPGISKLGSERLEQAASAKQEAVMTKALSMMVSVNSCGRRPHPGVKKWTRREGYGLIYRLHKHRQWRPGRPAEVFAGRHGRQA